MQQAGTRPVEPGHLAAGQPCLHIARQHFAQLDPPLVEAVDAPDRAADKNAVLLQRKQCAQALGGQRVEQQKRAWPVAWKVLVAAAIWLAEHQRLSLCQRVGEQFVVVARQPVRGFFYRDEFNRHHAASLVQHLKISMLAIGSGLAPKHGRGVKRQRLPIGIDALAVALHLQLLQVRGQAP